MERALPAAVELLSPTGWLAAMTTHADLPGIRAVAGPQFSWAAPVSLPGSDNRILALGQRLTKVQKPAQS